jgi:phosphoglycolate phosphatase-like HAD superfamily hydrolase
MTIKAIFFDFDLTLVDTGPIARAIFSAFCKHKKIKPTEKLFDAYMGGRLSDALDMFAESKEDRKALMKLFLKVHDEKMNHIRVYGKEILNYLKKRKIKVIIISNTSKKALHKVCKHFNLHFNYLVGDEDMPRGTGKHQAIKKTLKKLGLKKDEVFYVGDHINDIKEGKKAQVRVISVTTGVYSKNQLAKFKPYAIIKNLNELKQLI